MKSKTGRIHSELARLARVICGDSSNRDQKASSEIIPANLPRSSGRTKPLRKAILGNFLIITLKVAGIIMCNMSLTEIDTCPFKTSGVHYGETLPAPCWCKLGPLVTLSHPHPRAPLSLMVTRRPQSDGVRSYPNFPGKTLYILNCHGKLQARYLLGALPSLALLTTINSPTPVSDQHKFIATTQYIAHTKSLVGLGKSMASALPASTIELKTAKTVRQPLPNITGSSIFPVIVPNRPNTITNPIAAVLTLV